MDRQEIIEIVNELIYEEYDISEITADTTIDSLHISRIELLSLLEIKFEIPVPYYSSWHTFDDIYNYIYDVLEDQK